MLNRFAIPRNISEESSKTAFRLDRIGVFFAIQSPRHLPRELKVFLCRGVVQQAFVCFAQLSSVNRKVRIGIAGEFHRYRESFGQERLGL